jgi:hypothetical protein
MKFISYKKYLNEIFTEEESDPIKDMGIGLYTHRNFKNRSEFYKWFYEIAPSILDISNIEDVIYKGTSYVLKQNFYEKLVEYTEKYVTIDGREYGILDPSEFKQYILYRKIKKSAK